MVAGAGSAMASRDEAFDAAAAAAAAEEEEAKQIAVPESPVPSEKGEEQLVNKLQKEMQQLLEVMEKLKKM